MCAVRIHATRAADAPRPGHGKLYGFERALPPDAEMAAWPIFEHR
jgi:hypothetical protein